MAPWHWLSTQNFRVGTLQAASDDSIPATDFGGWIKTESCGTSKGEFFCETDRLFSPIAVPLKRQSAKIERVQTSTILCVKNWMVRILFTRFLLGNLSSCALAASVSHRVGVGTDRINVCIPAPRNTKKSYVCFRPTCGARPNIYARFPICLNAWDAIGTCGELTVCRANTIVTYKITPPRRTRQQMPPLSITRSTTFNSIRIDMRADICTKSIGSQSKLNG